MSCPHRSCSLQCVLGFGHTFLRLAGSTRAGSLWGTLIPPLPVERHDQVAPPSAHYQFLAGSPQELAVTGPYYPPSVVSPSAPSSPCKPTGRHESLSSNQTCDRATTAEGTGPSRLPSTERHPPAATGPGTVPCGQTITTAYHWTGRSFWSSIRLYGIPNQTVSSTTERTPPGVTKTKLAPRNRAFTAGSPRPDSAYTLLAVFTSLYGSPELFQSRPTKRDCYPVLLWLNDGVILPRKQRHCPASPRPKETHRTRPKAPDPPRS